MKHGSRGQDKTNRAGQRGQDMREPTATSSSLPFPCHTQAIHLFYFPSSSWPWCPDALARNRQNEKSIELNEWKSGKCINEWMTAGTVNSRSSIHLSTSRPVTRPFSAREWAAGLWESYVSEWSNMCAPREKFHSEKRRYIWTVCRYILK